MSKVPFSTPVAFNKVIHPRDPMPSVEHHAQKDREPYTEETQADNPYHNEAFLKSKMPKKAHKRPNVPACKNPHLLIIEVFPTARSTRKPNPTYILPKERTQIFSGLCGPQNPAFHKQLWAGVLVEAQRQMWWSCKEQHDKLATLYCPLKTLSDALKSKLALARTFMGPHSPSAHHSEKASTCSPQRPKRQHQPNSKGLCHNAYSAAHTQSTAYLHVTAVRTNSSAPRHLLNHGSICWNILENTKGSILRVMLKKEFNFQSHIGKQEGSILGVIFKKKLNSLSHIEKIQFFESNCEKKSSILLKLFFDPRFNSLSHISLLKKSSILWVRVQFFESYVIN